MEANIKYLVRQVWREYYHDFGVYRWLNRNGSIVRYLIGLPLVPLCLLAAADVLWPLELWGAVMLCVVYAMAFDYFYGRAQVRKILRRLEELGVDISEDTLNTICKYETPQ